MNKNTKNIKEQQTTPIYLGKTQETLTVLTNQKQGHPKHTKQPGEIKVNQKSKVKPTED